MKTAILIHGRPSKEEYFDVKIAATSKSHWFPWLQKKLLLNGVLAQTPEMPEAYQPNYEKWKWMFEQFKIDSETTLVGHSCGGGFLIRWLSENNVKVGRVVLVAPWLDPDHEMGNDFFDFVIDEKLVEKTEGLVIMYSTDDYSDIVGSVNILKGKLMNAEFVEFRDKGHFCFDDLKTEEFPELLEYLIK